MIMRSGPPVALALLLFAGCAPNPNRTTFQDLVDDLGSDVTSMRMLMDAHQTNIEGCTAMSDVMTEENHHYGTFQDMLDHMNGLLDDMEMCDTGHHMGTHMDDMGPIVDGMVDEMNDHHLMMADMMDVPSAVMHEHEHHDWMNGMLDALDDHHDQMGDMHDDDAMCDGDDGHMGMHGS